MMVSMSAFQKTSFQPAANEAAVEGSDSMNDQDAVHTVYSLTGLEWSVWRDAELGGGSGAPKNKRKPVPTCDHRGPLQDLSFASVMPYFRRVGAVWRHAWFWIRSTSNPILLSGEALAPNTALATQTHDVPRFFIPNQSAASGATHRYELRRRCRIKQARIMYQPACSGCSKCWQSRNEVPKSCFSSVGIFSTVLHYHFVLYNPAFPGLRYSRCRRLFFSGRTSRTTILNGSHRRRCLGACWESPTNNNPPQNSCPIQTR